MTDLRFNKKADLLAALEARRPWAEALDKANIAQHARDEKDYERRFRARCREMSKWSYDEIKSDYGKRYGYVLSDSMPSCPRSWVQRLNHQICCVERGMQQRFVIREAGSSVEIFRLLTHDESEQKDMCS